MIKSDTIKVIPVAGRLVRHRDGRMLDEKGEWVVRESYWRRRFDDGDIEIELPRAATRSASTEKKA